ncbi:proteasome protein [Aeromicrobium sp. A1-2]|uniref:PAC2 family protein n=1 Tax=Aeromicrobium sp. A1-2 TaxID=2107713 RepID=UPI000E51D8CE|nr:PAC2 family protein [Aeromicrobium sp. A1-2]AXT84837.1 proteasome protein [Aeromicrobium sp. A1-2]
MKWIPKRKEEPADRERNGPVLIHALDGFLGAGSAARLASDQLRSGEGQIVHEFDVDAMFDYRARRPMIAFREDHYAEYDDPRLQVLLEHDLNGTPYFLLAGPEPDFQWERFIAEVHDVIEEHDVPLTLGLGAVPMGVPHTRPAMITAHGTRPDLVDRQNLWSAQVTVPSSAQSLLEYRLGQWGHDAAGYVVHVPHYLAQIDYPTASLALIDALVDRTGLSIDLDGLRARQGEALAAIEEQIEEQGGASLLGGLEEQYDAFTRGAAQSLLASDADLPSGDELADQFEQFLARQRKNDQG